MNTKPKLISTLVLSIALAAGLSACAVQVTDPKDNTSPSPISAPEATDETTDGVTADTTAKTTDGGIVSSGACDSENVEVTQEAAQIVLTGRCGVVNVSSTGATVNVESADSIVVTGIGNTIIIDDKVAAVTLIGDRNFFNAESVDTLKVQSNENQVVLNAASDVSISGNNNFVQWSSGIGYSTDTGTGNTVVGP